MNKLNIKIEIPYTEYDEWNLYLVTKRTVPMEQFFLYKENHAIVAWLERA